MFVGLDMKSVTNIPEVLMVRCWHFFFCYFPGNVFLLCFHITKTWYTNRSDHIYT
jgi:hypothetical protein